MKGLLLLISLSVMVTTLGKVYLTHRFPYNKLHGVISRNPRRRTAQYALLGFLPLALCNLLSENLQLDAGGLGIGDIRILQLRVETPLFMLDMRGRIKPQGDYPLDLKTEWSVKYPGYAPIIGRGELTGTLKEIKVVQDVSAPFYAQLNATVTDVLTMPHWEVSLVLKGFNPQEINPKFPAVEIGGNIEGWGGYKDNRWYGEIKQADLTSPSLGRWVLEKSGRFTISLEQAQTDQWCWVNDITKVCLQTGWRKGVGSHGTAVISHLPLSIMKSMVPPGITVEGILDASVTALYSNKKVLTGEASFKTSMGSISYAISEGKEVILKFKEGIINSVLTEDSLNVKLELPLVDNGFINGWITLPAFSSIKIHREQQIIKGNINTEIRELGLVPVLFPEVEDTHGVFKGDITIAGTLADPYIMGKLRLDQGTTDVPRLGIRLEDINIDAVSDGKGIIEVNGKGRSGQGMVEVNGAINLQPSKGWPIRIQIKGEGFEAIKTPEVWILASPDMVIHLQDKRINLDGDILIPEAIIEPRDLSGAVSISRDVVIISDSGQERYKERWKDYSKIRLILGEKVQFNGFGITGGITGSIIVVEEPEKIAIGFGELKIVEGKYKAYGQKLEIERGRLIFAGGPVDDPILDVRAIRHIGEVIVGVNVQGRLKAPQLTLFSTPSMDQSDILSYIFLRRPLNQASNYEGQQLYRAALSLGLKGGGLLARRLGTIFGVEEVEIEQGTTPEETRLVIGKYISPSLYISYGISLLDPISILRLRYQISNKWLVQTEYGIQSGGDLFYKIEH